MSDSTARSVNPPKQRRSQETLDHLLRATRELLETTAFEDLTVQKITSRAGCSVGNFYARFKNKEAILLRLLDMHYAEIERDLNTKFGFEDWEGVPLKRRVDAVVDFLMAIAERQPGLIRTLVVRNNQRPDSIPASIRAAARRMLDRLYDFLLERRAEMSHPAERAALEVGLLMVVTAIRERIVLAAGTHGATLSVSNEVFAEELKQALLAYLTTTRR